MTGETQKIKHPKPILGMLQTSKSLLPQKPANNENVPFMDNHNLFDTIENDETNLVNDIDDQNPILNKRILLKVNYEQSNNIDSDFVPLDSNIDMNSVQNKDEAKPTLQEMKAKLYKTDTIGANELGRGESAYDRVPNEKNTYDKMKAVNPKHSYEGRIVVYGDSNCLDSTHIEKPCFWLLDALLEYTMSSHVPTILKDLNRPQNIRFDEAAMPKRIPNNNLHMYSKVLMPAQTNDGLSGSNDSPTKSSLLVKREIPKCNRLRWETPIFLNISAPNDFNFLNGRSKDDIEADSSNMVGELNLRRKLESQKGEVCSVESFELSTTFFVVDIFFC